jgi:hypothetical protein
MTKPILEIDDFNEGIPHRFTRVPAVRVSKGTLPAIGETCLSVASCTALPNSVPLFYCAGQGSNGFGSFCRIKRTSAVGPKPDISHAFTALSERKMWVGKLC